MNRRGFLSLIAPAAALIVAPELLLPKRTFFLPPGGGWSGGYPADFIGALKWKLAMEIAYPPLLVMDPHLYQMLDLKNIKPGGVHYIENRPIKVFGGTPPYTFSLL